MKVLEKGAPAAAIVAALSTLACCVPLGFLGAAGLASMSAWVQPLRPWLLGASVALLCLGCVQLYFRKSACVRRSTVSLVLCFCRNLPKLLGRRALLALPPKSTVPQFGAFCSSVSPHSVPGGNGLQRRSKRPNPNTHQDPELFTSAVGLVLWPRNLCDAGVSRCRRNCYWHIPENTTV